MFFDKLAVRGVRLLLALLFIAGMTVAVSAATQRPAQAITTCATPGPTSVRLSGEPAGEETYNFTPHVTCSTLPAPASQECQSKPYMTGNNTDFAQECVEIYVNTDHANNRVDIFGVGSYSCKSAAGDYINCGRISVDTAFTEIDHANGNSRVENFGAPYACSGNCPSSGPAQVSSSHEFQFGTESASNDCGEVWATATIAAGDEQVGGAVFTGDFSGPHVNICARDQISSL